MEDYRMNDQELKTKAIELAIKFIGTSDNSNRGYDVEVLAAKFYRFYQLDIENIDKIVLCDKEKEFLQKQKYSR